MSSRKQIFCVLALAIYLFIPVQAVNETFSISNDIASTINDTASATNDTTSVTNDTSSLPPLPPSVLSYMASRQMRYHHFLWHNIRNNWNRLSDAAKQAITDLGWAPPRPSRSFDADGHWIQITKNGAGEDFFYMHRYLILKYNKIVEVYNEPGGPVVGWVAVPDPTDEEYPVPPNYIIPDSTDSYNGTKTDSFYWEAMVPYEQNFTDPDYLRNKTLGELGAIMEVTIHTWMHLRWSSNSTYGFRPKLSGMIPDIDVKWDDPQYSWMGDFYASQVNPYFWKLHGWIDDRIEDWKTANNVTDLVWNGTWIGGPVSNLTSMIGQARRLDGSGSEGDMDDMDMAGEMDDTMPKVMKILLGEVEESTFADDVRLPD